MTQAQNLTRDLPPADWLGGFSEYPRDMAVHRLFEEQAVETPDAMALVAGAGYITYAELNGRANWLAGRLVERGVNPGEPVAVFLDRSVELIVALLAILKCGGCYVPLDPGYPIERVRGMAEDLGAGLIVTTRELAGGILGVPGRLVLLEEIEVGTAGNLSIESPATGAAYVMFTSGSTGRPKGVAVPHRAIVRLVRGQDYVSLSRDETFLQFAPASFDASTLEIWGPLLNGGRLAIAPPGQLSLRQIAETIRGYGVTSMWLTSGLFNLMADEQLDAFAPLRQLLAGGDVLSIPHLRKVMAAHTHLRLINGYGPTESTTFACCHTIKPEDLDGASAPIGRPIANTTVRILDEEGRQAPIGTPGELYIGGDGLALGYWNQPGSTAERFVELEGERYYRTGDRVQWMRSGAIQFLGRWDHQVKVRGYRIELGEIENALAAEAGVLRCVVVALGDGADKQLAAYYAGTAEGGLLREALRMRLPEYMVPAFFTRVESLPLTANGKVDRAKLPKPEALKGAAGPAEMPRNDLERTLAGLWSEILAHPAPGLNDNFFDIGGTSLKLVEAHSRLVRVLHRQIPVTALFQYPTIAALAGFLAPGAAPNAATGQSRLAAAAERARNQREALARKQLSQKVP